MTNNYVIIILSLSPSLFAINVTNNIIRSPHTTLFLRATTKFTFLLSFKWNAKSVTKRGNTMAKIWGKIGDTRRKGI